MNEPFDSKKRHYQSRLASTGFLDKHTWLLFFEILDNQMRAFVPRQYQREVYWSVRMYDSKPDTVCLSWAYDPRGGSHALRKTRKL